MPFSKVPSAKYSMSSRQRVSPWKVTVTGASATKRGTSGYAFTTLVMANAYYPI